MHPDSIPAPASTPISQCPWCALEEVGMRDCGGCGKLHYNHPFEANAWPQNTDQMFTKPLLCRAFSTKFVIFRRKSDGLNSSPRTSTWHRRRRSKDVSDGAFGRKDNLPVSDLESSALIWEAIRQIRGNLCSASSVIRTCREKARLRTDCS